ncbi:MAG: hypothetical protein WA901_09410 [Phormidesmis sp.]
MARFWFDGWFDGWVGLTVGKQAPLGSQKSSCACRLGWAMALWLCGTLHSALPAQAQRTTVFDLNQAICANQWYEAIGITGQLMANEQTTQATRQALLALRRQLEAYQTEGTIVGRSQACDVSDPYMLATLPVAQDGLETSLGWDVAVAEATDNQYASEIVTDSPQLTLPISLESRAGLTPMQPIDLGQGLNVVSGHVGSGHEVYGFVAGMGDRINIQIDVTRVMTGSLYTSDDSQLFVFDRDGVLIASSDDENGGNQSDINGLVVPKTDLYFAVVTSYNNDPIFNQDNRLMGWQDNGGGRFDYTLSVAGATPTGALIR